MSNRTYHILSGDGLAETLKQCGIEGEVIICRECLVEGPLDGDSFKEFLNTRAEFISDSYGGSSEDYHKKVTAEFEKIRHIPTDSEVNLWFGNDLFCQANMWFICELLAAAGNSIKVFRIFPFENGNPSIDFSGGKCSDLRELSLGSRKEFSADDLALARDLWKAYKTDDLIKLQELSKTESECFRDLDSACHAHIERFGENSRPHRVIHDIISDGNLNFKRVFEEFSKREPIYGFGDLQVKRLLDEIKDS